MQSKLQINIIKSNNYSVGKTSLLYQYVKNQFSQQYKATIGADFLTKNIQKGEDTLQLQIWDTAGTERYNSMGQNFYRSSEACILVFDLTVKDTFTNIDNWRKDFLSSLGPKDPDTFPFVLLGNKCDKVAERKVQASKIKQYCETKSNMPYFETSAKDNTNVEAAFEEVAKLAFKRNSKEDEIFIPNRVELKATNQQTQPKNCCPL